MRLTWSLELEEHGLQYPNQVKWNYSGIGFRTETVIKNPCARQRATRSNPASLPSSSRERNTAHLPEAPEFARPEGAAEFPPTVVILTDKEDSDMEKVQGFVSVVCDPR